MMNFYAQQLQQLKQSEQYRTLTNIQHDGKFILRDGHKMLNLSSNDYLGLASDQALKQQFLEQTLTQTGKKNITLTSSSSRLLTGNFPIYGELENLMAHLFRRQACLLFNSGYHANIGILPAITDKNTLIIADKLVHASLIDGIRLSSANYLRYRHNDYIHLQQILAKHAKHYQRIIIVTESVFSMDGDTADLPQLVELKQQYNNILLYVDEAHGFGVFGENGLGLAEKHDCIAQIDFLVGTFGKALASMGAYVICEQVMKDYLINKMRSLIFSTALPPLIAQWSYFLVQRLPQFNAQRTWLGQLSDQLRNSLKTLTNDNSENNVMPSNTHIVPYILGDNPTTLAKATLLQKSGFYCLPIRPPTVPRGSSRIRFSLTADISQQELNQLIHSLEMNNTEITNKK